MWTFAALAAVVLCAGAAVYFIGWERIKELFLGSETIAFARFQMLVGAVGAVAAATDFTTLFAGGMPKKETLIVFCVVFAQGVLTEYFRRRRDPNLGKDV